MTNGDNKADLAKYSHPALTQKYDTCVKKTPVKVKVLIQRVYSSQNKKAQVLKCSQVKSKTDFFFAVENETIHLLIN